MAGKDDVVIEIEINEETAAWLIEEAVKTGKTIDEIINEAIWKSLTILRNEKVLVSKNRIGSRSLFCTQELHNFDRLTLTSWIVSYNNAAELHIFFENGRELQITPETTWDEVNAYLDAIFRES